ncbi:gluconate kinase [Neolewinella aurantiaca]|uniref:Gluconate kinase n=1 Tax=Neolewinella aurantiaca TaxID=2602767 RepID=A0A5C7FK94_9BACT|nr:gluconokinase [Neolewinella aurantiaca]TXF85215.1 gluconate kinase [Neolewinella aurantiaca]
MTYKIGLDIGTTATKACAFNGAGEMIGIIERDYELLHPEPGAAEQQPAAVFSAAEEALTELVKQTEGKPASVGLSCPMHSLLLLDKNYAPLGNVITWADARPQDAMKGFTDQEGYDLHELTGTPVHPMSPLVKLCWLANGQPGQLQTATYISDLKSALVLRWTESGFLLDEQLASATGLMNLETSQWASVALEKAGIRKEQLPQIKPAATKLKWRESVAKKLGLTGVPLYLGGSDGVLANLGSGIMDCGDIALSIGTSGALRTTHTKARIDARLGLFNYKMKEGLYVIGGPTNNGGKVLEYWQNLLAAHFEDVGAFIDGAVSVASGDSPTFGPWLYGERAPLWDATATASLTGLMGHHQPAHIARAVLDGVTDNLINILHNLEAVVGPADRILGSGGFTKSPEWTKLIAERSGRQVVIADAAQASAYGAALVSTVLQP